MKIIFIGLGSIGQRHLKNLARIFKIKKQACEIDALRKTTKDLPMEIKKLLTHQYTYSDNIPQDYDISFITNPTSMHYDTLKLITQKAKHIFLEKPVFDSCTYDVNNIYFQKNAVCYIACPLRYTKVIQYLKKFIKKRKVFNIRAICSTYLPDWHPNADYRMSYSANEKLGGGVAIDLIHEWDYISYLFGVPAKVYRFAGKYSDLEINSEDTALYIAQYPDKTISLHLDYFGRYERREIEIYLENDVIVGDLINNQVRFLKKGKVIQFKEDRNDFQSAELEYFIDLVEGKKKNTNDIETAISVLKIAKGEYNA